MSTVLSFPVERAPGASKKNRILATLGTASLARLNPDLELVKLGERQELAARTREDGHVFFPTTAVISHMFASNSGDVVEALMVGQEGVSGLSVPSLPDPAVCQSIVCVPGDAWRIPSEKLQQAAQSDSCLSTRLMDLLDRQVMQAGQRLLCITFHQIEQRLAAWLLMLDDRVNVDRLGLTHEQIAMHLGTSRVTVSIAARVMRERGIIDYVRGKLRILDRAALKDAACECYSIQRDLFEARAASVG